MQKSGGVATFYFMSNTFFIRKEDKKSVSYCFLKDGERDRHIFDVKIMMGGKDGHIYKYQKLRFCDYCVAHYGLRKGSNFLDDVP